jgi:hypothetical protein
VKRFGFRPTIYGDPKSEETFVSYARSGGVRVTGIALADETGSLSGEGDRAPVALTALSRL